MKRLTVMLLMTPAQMAIAQAEPSVIMTPRNSFTFSFDYAPTSEHLFLGESRQRKLAEIEVGYRQKLVGNAYAQWSWEIDAQPLVFMQEPLQQQSFGSPDNFGASYRVPYCSAGTTTTSFLGPNGPVQIPVTTRCGSITDRAVGFEPLGQHIRLLPFSRVAPFVEANAGFLIFNRNIPSDQGSRFNFEFSGGAGLEFALPRRRMVAAEYRVHHISNAYIAPDNSGIDQQMFRLSYVFGR